MRRLRFAPLALFFLGTLFTLAAQNPAQNPAPGRGQAAAPGQSAQRNSGPSPWPATPTRRPDVLVYASEILQKPITVVGPVSPSLWVVTSGTDSDFVVKLIDVFPDRYRDAAGNLNGALGGYQMMVRGDIIRGKFRDSLEKPVPFTPHQPTAVSFTTSDIYHTFLPGHRIMVQIQSTWFPLSDLNPQRFENIDQAKSSDFQKATERIYHTSAMPSHVKVLVIPPGTL